MEWLLPVCSLILGATAFAHSVRLSRKMTRDREKDKAEVRALSLYVNADAQASRMLHLLGDLEEVVEALDPRRAGLDQGSDFRRVAAILAEIDVAANAVRVRRGIVDFDWLPKLRTSTADFQQSLPTRNRVGIYEKDATRRVRHLRRHRASIEAWRQIASQGRAALVMLLQETSRPKVRVVASPSEEQTESSLEPELDKTTEEQ